MGLHFKIKYVLLFLGIGMAITACKKKSETAPEEDPIKTPAPIYDITFTVPNGWPQPAYNYTNNLLTANGFELGRSLFYDPILSVDNTISCGSCHQQFAGFAHAAHNVSHGIFDRNGTRNSPGLFNLNWNTSFMWDGGVNHIEVMPLAPIQNPVEMGETVSSVISKLSASEKYKALFKKAFGTEEINSQKMLRALAQFMGMLVSNNSEYDKYKNGSVTWDTTSQKYQGYKIFQQKCNTCHKEPLFTDYSFRNNGLPINPSFKDSGRSHITLDPNDVYKFKVPSLRNIGLTSPYSHDGRFNLITEMLDHYSSGIVQSPTLDPALSNGFTLSSNEKVLLFEFLKTLNDNTFRNDPRFKE
jgi:cytochrome c peroxidase